jgi:sugar lactone lactonase YvrE
MEVLAGSGRAGFADGAGAAAQFNIPHGVAVDGEGNFIVADQSNHRVRKIAPDGTASTLAGSAIAGFADGDGAAAQFYNPYGVAVDGEGNVIVSDKSNNRVRKIAPDGTVSTLAGSGRAGCTDGAGAAAQFNSPLGVAVDGEGNAIVADAGNERLRKITPDGTVSTLAESGIQGFADGAGEAAQFNCPYGVAVDGEGIVIVADYSNNLVRKIAPDGTVSTLAVSVNVGRFGFGAAGAAPQFHNPCAVAVDGEGNVIVANQGTQQLCKITPNGTVSTYFAGSCVLYGIAIDSDG